MKKIIDFVLLKSFSLEIFSVVKIPVQYTCLIRLIFLVVISLKWVFAFFLSLHYHCNYHQLWLLCMFLLRASFVSVYISLSYSMKYGHVNTCDCSKWLNLMDTLSCKGCAQDFWIFSLCCHFIPCSQIVYITAFKKYSLSQ